jgi:replicative DNA helicase
MPSPENIDKIPPQSMEAEAAVLGSMLLDRESIVQAIELLN